MTRSSAAGPAVPCPCSGHRLHQWGAVDLALRDAALACGYAWKPNLNAAGGEGISCNPINSRGGHRVTTNDAYLEPARGRPNLHIRGGALVDRVLFHGATATGVRVRFDGGAWEDVTGREVVLCAGAIHSPAILLRSGIGPAASLQALGIPVLHDNAAVGRNLMDHPVIRATLHLRPAHQAQGEDARHTNCCVTYSSHLGGGGERDMIIIAYNHRGGTSATPGSQGAVGAGLYEAFSRGELSLQSADPEVDPAVEENMLSDPRDRLRMRDAVGRLAALTASPALAGISEAIRLGETALTLPEAAALPPDELDAVLLDQAADIQHAAGTCRMTAYEDPRGVVDPALAVRGVRGLRVCDASVMPADCRANLHFTCVMIGENLARRMDAGGHANAPMR